MLFVIAIPVWSSLQHFRGVAFRDNLDVFSTAMTTPLYFVFPVLVVAVTCTTLSQELGNRYAANLRTRIAARQYVLGKIASVGLIAFVLFFVFAAVPFIITFVLWPAWGNPGVDPSAYYLTPASAIEDSAHRFSYSQLMSAGPLTYGIAYSAWVGLSGATFSILGAVGLFWIRNRFLALAAPFLLYLVETVVAALLGFPHAGLTYSVFPFGLVQAPVVLSALPVIIVLVCATIGAVLTVRRAQFLETLS